MKTTMQPALTFKALPEDEKGLIRSVLNAVNKKRPALALNHKRDDARQQRPKADDEWTKFWDRYDEDEMCSLRTYLHMLADGKRLHDDALHDLAGIFEADHVMERCVRISHGSPTFDDSIRFKKAAAAIAFAVLRLAQISAHDQALVCCAECGVFELRLSTGGDKISRFCSAIPSHRNRFNQRAFQKRKRDEAAKKAAAERAKANQSKRRR